VAGENRLYCDEHLPRHLAPSLPEKERKSRSEPSSPAALPINSSNSNNNTTPDKTATASGQHNASNKLAADKQSNSPNTSSTSINKTTRSRTNTDSGINNTNGISNTPDNTWVNLNAKVSALSLHNGNNNSNNTANNSIDNNNNSTSGENSSTNTPPTRRKSHDLVTPSSSITSPRVGRSKTLHTVAQDERNLSASELPSAYAKGAAGDVGSMVIPPHPRNAVIGLNTSKCEKCKQIIVNKFLRAGNARFHTECFSCYDCGLLFDTTTDYYAFETGFYCGECVAKH
jgi:hypothetical protein